MRALKLMEKDDIHDLLTIYDIRLPAFAVTLSLKNENNGIRLDDFKCDTSYRRLMCGLSRYYFGRNRGYLKNIAFRERGDFLGRLHIHALIENPGTVDIVDFSDKMVGEWRNSAYGYEPHHGGWKTSSGGFAFKNTYVENVFNAAGWISYSTKYKLDIDKIINIASSYKKVTVC